MGSKIPDILKSQDISRFAQRAAQVEKAKPVIAYWCNYWIVNQLISKGLHIADDECTLYTTKLMDKLEKTKIDYAEESSIVDDLAGQAYVEQFGLKIFQRAENAMRANKVSRQTADTFSASAAFLELNQIWGPLDPELSAKIKFAKFHALRIAKAIRAGEDPNLSNPALDQSSAQEKPLSDEIDSDAQLVRKDLNQQRAYQPSIEDVPDEHDNLEHRLAQRSSIDQSLHPSRAPSVPRQPEHLPTDNDQTVSPNISGEEYYQNSSTIDVSPINSSPTARKGSIGGGYFPQIPHSNQMPHSGSAPPVQPGVLDASPLPSPPDMSALPPETSIPPGIPQHPFMPRADPVPSFSPTNINQNTMPDLAPRQTPSYPHQLTTVPPSRPVTMHPTQPPIPQPRPASTHASFNPPLEANADSQVVVTEEAILKAQKHAKWAISALNFEDVPTAIKELRGALRSLGAG
ncbi:MAG: hypothetical protein Q9190_006224 [Brigantiaea leucoxantha]